MTDSVSKQPRLEGKENVMMREGCGPCSPRVRTASSPIRTRRRARVGAATYLPQRLQPGLHDELVLAELAAARVGALDPLLQAGLVHEVQAARAVAGRDQGALVVALAVADPGGESQRHRRG